MLERVISGGQIGVDIAALRAAAFCGIPTGGTAPKNWMTLKGSNEQQLRNFGLVECSAKGYPARTERNVRNSDCTIRIALDWSTAGEACTIRCIDKHKKPYLDITMYLEGAAFTFNKAPTSIAHWIIHNDHNVINVAGNAKAYVEHAVENYLTEVFQRVIDYKDKNERDRSNNRES